MRLKLMFLPAPATSRMHWSKKPCKLFSIPAHCSEEGDCLSTRGKMHNASTWLAGIALWAGLGFKPCNCSSTRRTVLSAARPANALLLTAVIRFNVGDPRAAKLYVRLAKRAIMPGQRANDTASLNALMPNILNSLKQPVTLPTLPMR